MRFLPFLLTLLLPTTLWANCGGVDLRDTLTPTQHAEISTRLANVHFSEGNHWTATKGGRTLHVIGTMHIADPRMDALMMRLTPTIQNAQMILVEATLEAQAELQTQIATNPKLAFLSGKTLIELMPEEDWAALAAAAKARGIPPFMAAKFQPWYLSLVLSMSPCTLRTMARGAKGLDTRIMELAAQTDVPTRSIEPYEMIFSLFAQDSLEEQIKTLSISILPEAHTEDAIATVIEQYFEEAHGAALETSRVVTQAVMELPKSEFDARFDGFMELLLDKRNLNWIDTIEAVEEDRIVVAVGALHLSGGNGILSLLESRGYQVTRQPF